MADTFLTRIPTLADEVLREYLRDPGKYKREAIEAAIGELRKRGQDLPEDELARIRGHVQEREALKHESRAPRHGFLRDAGGPRMTRIRAIALAILAAGFGAGVVIFRLASTRAALPFDMEPSDSKSYLRQVEMMGGTANVLASQIRLWFTGLWQGTTLAYTVFGISVGVAGVFWLWTTRRR